MITSVKQIKEMVGVEGIDVSLKIKDVYEIKKGDGEFGPYSFQNVLLTDGHDSIMASLRNRDEVSKKEIGLRATFTSVMSDKAGKKTGVKVIEETYEKDGKEKTAIKLVITATAEAVYGDIKSALPPEVFTDKLDDKTNSMILSYAKDLTIACIEKNIVEPILVEAEIKGFDETKAGLLLKHWYNLLISLGKKEVVEEIKQ